MFRFASCVLLVAPALLLAQPVSSPRLVYATYVGTGPSSGVNGFALDSAGYAYLAGTGPGTGNSTCQFITKLNQTGSAAVWSVCLPLSEVDAVAVDASGYIYVVGANPSINAVHTAVVMKLSPDAQQTIYSTQIDGAYAGRIAPDAAGNAYISGSADSTFQATAGAYMSTGGNAFAVKLNTTGTIAYATYLDLYWGAVAVDSKGEAWVVGTACTQNGPPADFCVRDVSGTAAGIRKLDAKGATLLASRTFGGGSSGHFLPGFQDSATSVAVDATDSVWVVGNNETGTVPTTPNALEIEPAASLDLNDSILTIGYALKLSPSGGLLYGTYVGNNQNFQSYMIDSVAVDAQGRPYFALNDNFGSGFTPTSTVMALSPDGTNLVVSEAFGSLVQTAALDGSGGLYLAGNTIRLAFFATPGVYQALYPGGGNSGYAAKFDLTTPSPAAQLYSMANAGSLANYLEAPVAPGEIVTLFGVSLPSNPKLTFDRHAATILFANATQINAVIPFEVSAPSTVVSLDSVGGFVLPVWPAVPGLFTANASGSGQLAALNQDGSINSDSNPAKAGSIVSVFMTGVGAMTPPIGDGQLGPLQPPFPAPVLGVSATVNGVEAPVLFAGQAPGLIAGAVQVNIQIPDGTASGDAKAIVYIGNYQTQLAPTTIAVK